MFTLYLVCLILGGALVVLSIFGLGDTDVDVADVGADASLEADVSEVGALGGITRVLNPRNWIFFAAFFGLTGTLFTLLGVPSFLTPFFAVGAGLAAAATLHTVMTWLGDRDAGEVPGASALEGALGRVIVAFDEARAGKIAVRGGGQTTQLVARVHETADTRRFQVGDEVVIVDVADGIALVAGSRFLA
jgi:hypothetical protein